MSGEPHPKSKIIIDDDWKSRVEAERETLRQEQSTKDGPVPSPKTESAADEPPLPAPTFPLLLSTLATEALAALGQFPQPGNDKPVIKLDHAKHFIDTLSMLQEKTKGNLTPEENAMLENVLHELRMAFVAISSRR